jgi:hypothetical protein
MNLTNSKETQKSVAFVGLGGAGMSILKKQEKIRR